MDCSLIKELILTDYADGQADQETIKKVDDHVHTCADCRQFHSECMQRAVNPFRNSGIVTPPQSIWINIQENIHNRPRGVMNRVIDYVINLLSIKRSVFAAAAVAAAVFIAVIYVKNPSNNAHLVDEYIEEQMEFLSSLDNGVSDNTFSEGTDLGTAIEEYLF